MSESIKILLVTGSRKWTNTPKMRQKIYDAARGVDRLIVVQGGAAGADKMAREIAAEQGHYCVEYPADWKTLGKAAGLIRNKAMLDGAMSAAEQLGCPIEVIAFKEEFGATKGGGTEHMVGLCKEAGLHGALVRR